MLVRRCYDERLAQAGYLIACQATGEAIVVDPSRNIAPYVDAARQEGVRITRVTETHIHADFVSGTRELAAATGAAVLLSAEGGADWQYRYPADDVTTPLRDGNLIELGRVRFTVRHTPGHTPEHLAFIVTDTVRSDDPVALLSGDFVFVGDVGRPDLLEVSRRHRGEQGTQCPSALPVVAAPGSATGLPADLARPRCRFRLRQGTGLASHQHAWL